MLAIYFLLWSKKYRLYRSFFVAIEICPLQTRGECLLWVVTNQMPTPPINILAVP